MRNKRGFTLIELMAVITILVILSLIIIPIVDTNVKKSKNNMYIIQIENIRNAGRNYFSDHASQQPMSGRYNFVTLGTLIEEGYITQIKNPKTGDPFEYDIYVQILNDEGNYKYNVCPIEDDCEAYQSGGGVISGFRKVRDVNPGAICGDGIEEDYNNNDICYIYSVEDLVEFSNMVNDGYTFQNKTVKLMNNLDITNPKSYVTPEENDFGDVNGDGEESETLLLELSDQTSNGYPVIGSDSKQFMGTFDGGAHFIAHLYIKNSSNYTGLFGYNSGLIKGLILQNTIINGAGYVGGIAGRNSGTIQSVRFDGSVTGTGGYVGGIAGYSESSIITDVIVDAYVSGTDNVGGITGRTYWATAKGVFRSGSVTGGYNTNKVIGYINDYSTVSAFSLDSILVNTSATTSASIGSSTGYTTNSTGIKSIPLYEQIMDTYMGGDNNNDGYYFDYDVFGNIELYSLIDRPLTFKLTGSGTQISPYLINNYDDLKQVAYRLGDSSTDLYYKLNSDIDMSDKNQIMLSSESNVFKGNFDGNLKEISNYSVLGYNYVGLFGVNNGTVKDIRLSAASVNGYDYVGSLFGYTNGTNIGSLVTGSNVVSGHSYIGGLAGKNQGTIQSIYFNGNVIGTSSRAGGAVGESDAWSSITDALVDANVDGYDYVGGIAGRIYGTTLKAVYRSGRVTSTGTANKSIGYISDYCSISSFSLDSILVNTTATTSASIGSSTGYTTNSTGIKSIPLYEQFMDTYIGGDNNNDGYYFDYDNSGNIQLYNLSERPLTFALSGSGTEASPYMLNTYDDLRQLSYRLGDSSSGLYYKLNSNIDLSNTNMLMLSSESNVFKGNFDGNLKEISNYNVLGYNYVGLFGVNNGTVKDIRLSAASVNGYDYVGSLFGQNNGIHIGSWTTGNNVISGSSRIGGIVGQNHGTIQSVYFNGSVTGTSSYIGGISGYSESSNIIDALVDAHVSGSSNVGGITGRTYWTTVKGVFRSGSVTGGSSTNKVIGYINDYSTVSAFSLDSILVNTTATTSASIGSSTGYTTNSTGIKSIPLYDYFMDTYMGGDNNNDGYYFDYDNSGDIQLYKLSERPLTFALSGSGTEASPYLLNTYDDLRQLSYRLGETGLYYKLNSNIDLSNTNQIALSSYANTFKGTFDGNLKTISNFNLVGYSYTGLFGVNNGTIKNVKLSNAAVTGYEYVGSLIGSTDGTLTSSWVNNNISISGSQYIGGITGYNSGPIQSVYFNGSVTGTSSYIGGISGLSYYTSISDALVDATVYSLSSNVGGLVGRTKNSTLRAVYRSGSVTGSSNTNKAVGSSSESSLGTFTLDSILVNTNATTSTEIGSLTGYTVDSTGIKSIPLYEQIMDTYMGGDNNGDSYYFDYDNSGNIQLYNLIERPLTFALSGSGTQASPYLLNTYDDLRQLSYRLGVDSTGLYYKLNSNINLSNTNMIMLSSESNTFKGNFDGNLKTISNLNTIGYNYVGLFGVNNGTIKNIRLSNVNVSGFDYVGSLIGASDGILIGTWVNNYVSISGRQYIGGIAGYIGNPGTAQSIYFNGTVTGTSSYVGGITGHSYYTSISDALVDATVSSNGSSVGGLIGRSKNSTIKAVYRSGSVPGTSSNKSIGSQSESSLSTITLDSILVNGTATTSTEIGSLTGYTVSSSSINDISVINQCIDTSLNGDDNIDNYYFDVDGSGIVQLYNLSERPL